MKNLFATTCIVVLFSGASVHAERASCAEIGSLAHTIMEARQSGTPMSRVMEILEDFPAAPPLVIAAYGTPRFSTKSYQAEAASDFRNEVEVLCYGTST